MSYAGRQAAEMVGRIAAALLEASGAPSSGRPGAALRQAVGDLEADAEDLIAEASISAPLRNCFELARLAGATAAAMAVVRATILDETPANDLQTAIVQASLRYCLGQEARIIAETTYRSRQDVEAVLADMNLAFGDAEISASDAEDAENYRSLLSLHATVTRHLSATARPLPQIVTRTFGRRMPSLWIAQRVYGDGARAAELLAENHVVHPAFVPESVRLLTR